MHKHKIPGYTPKRERIGRYSGRFAKVKTEFLALKWDIDSSIDGGLKARAIKSKLSKAAKIMFDIEHDFIQTKS